MSGPIDSLRQLYDASIRPVYEQGVDIVNHVVPVVENVVDAASDAGQAVAEAAGDVGQAAADAAIDVRNAIDAKSPAPLIVDAAGVGFDLFTHNVVQQASILKELGTRSPEDFVNWLAGPEGPSVESYTRLVPGLQGGIAKFIDTAMLNPLISGAAGKAFSFEYVAGKDFYTTNESGLQSYTGFHTVYDKVGKLLGMDLKDKVMEFEANGVEYKLELWKGSYGSGGAYGGEIGFYTRGANDRGLLGNILEHIPGYYSSAQGVNQIKTTQEIYNNARAADGTPLGGAPFVNAGEGADGADGKHFWNLAIRTDPGVSNENIGQRGTLEFSGVGANVDEARNVAEAAFAAMQEQGVPNAKLSQDHLTITYDWPPGS